MLRQLEIRTIQKVLAIALAGIAVGCGDDKAATIAKAQFQAEAKPTAPLPPTGFEFNLSQPTLPPYVVAYGLSVVEPWGRWSDSDRVVFKFGSNLPNKFVLAISAKAFGPNAGPAIPVKVGAMIKEMQLSADATTVVRLEYALNSATDSIEIGVPKPTIPKNGDVRTLGIALSSIKIEPLQ